MTTLSAARTRAYANSHINGLPILTSTTIWAGGAVGINPITRAVRALVGGDLFVGFAQSSVNHVPGQQRDTAVSIVQSGQVTLAVSGAVQADVGKDVYATDDDTFTLSSTGASFVGVAKQLVSAGKLLVEIAPPSMLNVVRRSSDGTALVSGDGTQWLIPGAATFTASDAGTDWYRVPDVLQVAATLDSGTSTTVLVEVRTAAGVVSTALTITADTVAQVLRSSILTMEMHEFRIRRSSGTGTVTITV